MTRYPRSGEHQECPVTRETIRWAVSPLDFCVHLLPEASAGVLTARCGHLLPTGVSNYDQPPPGPPCEDCRLILLADFALHAAAGALTDALRTLQIPAGRRLSSIPRTVPGGRSVPFFDNSGTATEVGGGR
jgi:hypothetical protein